MIRDSPLDDGTTPANTSERTETTTTRRTALKASAAAATAFLSGLAGCSALSGSGIRGDAAFPSSGSGSSSDGGSSGGTATPTETSTPTPTGTADAESTETPTPTPTPTPTVAPPPPSESVSVSKTTVDRTDSGIVVEVTVSNDGSYTFTYFELRLDLYYDPIGRERFHVDYEYVGRRYRGGFSAGTKTFEAGPFQEPSTTRSDIDRFEVVTTFRRIQTPEPTTPES